MTQTYRPEDHAEHEESMQERFDAFLLANPAAYPKFCELVKILKGRGIKHYSADAICHVMRYHSAVDGRPEDQYKINNNHVRFFSRKWQQDNPDDVDFFFSREIRSA